MRYFQLLSAPTVMPSLAEQKMMAGLNNADSGENVADEVKVTRAVENIDLAAAEVYGSDGSCNCDLTLDFFGVIVADGISVGDLAPYGR